MPYLRMILFGISIVLLIASCSSSTQTKFSRYIIDDIGNFIPAAIDTIYEYEVKQGVDVLSAIITVVDPYTLRRSYINDEKSYNLEYYSDAGILEKTEFYRGDKRTLTNHYLVTEIGVPVLEYQVNASGDREQLWKPSVSGRSITLTQQVEMPFINPSNITKFYNEKGQVIKVERDVKGRPMLYENYQYDSLGNVTRYSSKREGEGGDLSQHQYTYDERGNWTRQSVQFSWDGHTSNDTYLRKIVYKNLKGR
jgi:hypothetical protein